jgi:hypothetical protein
LAGDPQHAGGLVLISPGVFQDVGQEMPVHLSMGFCVKVAGIRYEMFADKCNQVKCLSRDEG